MRKLIYGILLVMVLASPIWSVTYTKIWIASEPITAADLNDNFDDVGTAVDDSGVPAGIIVLWSGSSANIPSGWVLCNGSNGTPNLSGKFIVAHGGSYTAGDTGGAASTAIDITATSSENPSHGHTVDINTSTPGNGTESATTGTDYLYTDHIHSVSGTTGDNGTHTHTLNATGTVSNLPPYYSLCYIMKS